MDFGGEGDVYISILTDILSKKTCSLAVSMDTTSNVFTSFNLDWALQPMPLTLELHL